MPSDSLEIALSGKRFAISLEPLHNEVREELRAMFEREVDALMILKAFITKAQEYATLCQSLESLCQSLSHNLDEKPQIHIQSLQTP